MAILMNNGKPVIANDKLVKGEAAVVGYNLTVSFIDGQHGRGQGALIVTSNGASEEYVLDYITDNPTNFTNVTSITIYSEAYGSNDYFYYKFNDGAEVDLMDDEEHGREASISLTQDSTLVLRTCID